MIDVKEHFYDDDPTKGHPDVRTILKDVAYFFLGNGYIQAAVQIAPSGEGTLLGLLIMNPEHLKKKREALTFDPQYGLENTIIQISSIKSVDSPDPGTLQASWSDEYRIPAVQVKWKSDRFKVTEHFYCPNCSSPVLIREVRIKNLMQRSIRARIQTGILQRSVKHEFVLALEEEKKIYLRYTLDSSSNSVRLDVAPEKEVIKEALSYWRKTASASFGSSLLDHYFNASKFQLSAVISKSGRVDGSIWQYNREWVRDQAMMVVGLTLSGHHEIARTMLNRLFEEFVTDEGDTIDSSEKREKDEVELDQNGVLLYALRNYVLWTGDFEVITTNWNKIEVTAEFPLKDIFRHPPSGLLTNTRDYWERHKVHGIVKGMELANQLFTIMGLSSAALLARMISREPEASRWEREAERIRHAFLYGPQYRLVDRRGLIKRRNLNGAVQETVNPSPEAQLPEGVPLSTEGIHLLNPDASCALPIATGFISPDTLITSKTLANLESLWNQSWENGGYGRYHVSSEPDSPGSWTFPSLFIARAYVETGDFEKVWRVLKWLNTVPGARAGSWFEFYGNRLSPPFPQIGIPPWTWAEMLILLIHNIIGVRPESDHLWIRPKILPGIESIRAIFPLRGTRLNLEIKKDQREKSTVFRSNSTIIQKSEKEVCLSYSRSDLWVEALVP